MAVETTSSEQIVQASTLDSDTGFYAVMEDVGNKIEFASINGQHSVYAEKTLSGFLVIHKTNGVAVVTQNVSEGYTGTYNTISYTIGSFTAEITSSTSSASVSDYPCFLKGTLVETKDGMVKVEDLMPGMLVKTYKHDYVPIRMAGHKIIVHNGTKERVPEQLYVCTKEDFPEGDKDLVITGCHSILKSGYTDDDEEHRSLGINGDYYLTDGLLRVPAAACLKAKVYPEIGTYDIYHIALDHEDQAMNYGIYANGHLVESCSIRYMTNFSQMTLKGEKGDIIPSA